MRKYFSFVFILRAVLYAFSFFLFSSLFHSYSFSDWEIFGPTRVNGTVGNGSLSCGISKWGEITVLRYPHTSHWDQLDYKTLEGEASRELKYFGASENQGAFFIIKIGDLIFSLRDIDEKNIKQYYSSYDSGVLITEYSLSISQYGVDGKVFVKDFVHYEKDVLVREVDFQLNTTYDVYLFHYQNFAPTTIKTPKIPFEDWQDDTLNDFGAFEKDKIAFHFTPYFSERKELYSEYIRVKDFSSWADVVSYANSITGIFIGVKAIGVESVSSYVGFDGRCGGGRAIPLHSSLSAFSKVKAGDFKYEPNSFALCSADSFVGGKVCGNSKCLSPVYFVISAGRTLKEMEDNINFASENIGRLKSDTENYWHSIVSKMRENSWFEKLKDSEKVFCSRALISLMQVIDRETKAGVASLSTQPPYAEDWPRDGSYFNLFLDIVGFTQLARERNLFYVKVQRKEQEGNAPAGSFYMNYYADGMPGGPWDFEIDQVGFVVWSWIAHSFFEGGKDKFNYLKQIYEPLKLSVENVFINCRDDQTRLHCRANEDDDPIPSISMTGAGPVYAGLRLSMKIAELMGDSELAKKINNRFEEYHQAVIDNFTDKSKGFVFSATDPHQGMAYVLFPMGFRFPSKDWIINYGNQVIDVLNYNFSPERGYLLYEAKWIISLIYASELIKNYSFSDYKRFRDIADGFLKVLVEDVPTEGTYHMGEVAIYKDGRYENRIAIPHVWEAVLTCLTAITFAEPSLLKEMGMEFPEPPQPKSKGCSSSDVSQTALFVSLIFLHFIYLKFRFRNLKTT
ncbi:hypothetical protein HRbin19_01189 [bacterium HR19]|nr:hypothetical protein HRbin19_01189 [bacterium HR19]